MISAERSPGENLTGCPWRTLGRGRDATVIVTAGHCTFAIGENGVSTTSGGEATTAAEGGGGGNDVWVDFSEEAHFDGWPATADYGPDENPQRYIDRSTFLEDSPFWSRGTSFPHPEYDDNAFFLFDAGVVVLDDPVDLDEYGGSRRRAISTATPRNRATNIASRPSAMARSGSRARRSPLATRG